MFNIWREMYEYSYNTIYYSFIQWAKITFATVIGDRSSDFEN